MKRVARLADPERPILITGGCGFIGCNLANALASRGRQVIALDNFARAGAQENRDWLKSRHGERVVIEPADVRDADVLDALVARAGAILHLAAQVAVTTSLDDPKADFSVNAAGTLNVLEAVRRRNPAAPVIFASTNKVYGRLFSNDAVALRGDRYEPIDKACARGIGENTPLDLYSPYGCSKGAADQYVLDYARVFGLRTAVFRMSCIYGVRQFGTEDQGWVAHFLKQAIAGRPITLYGDGCQVRDILYIDDAVNAWIGALDRIDSISGRVFNLGGGIANSVSLRELLDLIAGVLGRRSRIVHDDWRPGDQPWYVSDITAIGRAIEWSPRVPVRAGIAALLAWLTRSLAPQAAADTLVGAQA
ncbi:MAG TPA: NAD-dependent epimerase/dehydratase family protein [Pseudolabrys sp.]|nr:NAD-dependent epimerase/dehydratase family protein [Pseudolabrys sp.]